MENHSGKLIFSFTSNRTAAGVLSLYRLSFRPTISFHFSSSTSDKFLHPHTFYYWFPPLWQLRDYFVEQGGECKKNGGGKKKAGRERERGREGSILLSLGSATHNAELGCRTRSLKANGAPLSFNLLFRGEKRGRFLFRFPVANASFLFIFKKLKCIKRINIKAFVVHLFNCLTKQNNDTLNT